MSIIKMLEHISGHSGPWNDKEILQAVEKVRVHKESRERIATSVLQGICASGPGMEFNNTRLSKEAVALADALIEELNK